MLWKKTDWTYWRTQFIWQLEWAFQSLHMCGGSVGREIKFEWTRYEIKVTLSRNSEGKGGRTNLDSILKSRDITLPTRVHLVKAIVFPVVMYGCENWIIKKAEHQRTDAFEPWCWRRFLRDTWIARRSNHSFLKEISPEYSLEGLMLQLNLQ